MRFCIDSNIFIHGIKKNSGQDDLIERAKHFFYFVYIEKHEIIIPTIVIAEILAPEPLEKYPVYIDYINKNFIVSNFDSRVATQYGVLLNNRIEELKKIADENGIPRNRMKIDHQIIASAIVHGANRIYSNDNGVHTFGKKFIEVRDLPDLPAPQLVQQSIFNDFELVNGVMVKKETSKPEHGTDTVDDLPF